MDARAVDLIYFARVLQSDEGKGHSDPFVNTMGLSLWRWRQLPSKAAGGPCRFLAPPQYMVKAVQFRRHALAPQVRVFPAKKRYRVCKKISVPLLFRGGLLNSHILNMRAE